MMQNADRDDVCRLVECVKNGNVKAVIVDPTDTILDMAADLAEYDEQENGAAIEIHEVFAEVSDGEELNGVIEKLMGAVSRDKKEMIAWVEEVIAELEDLYKEYQQGYEYAADIVRRYD